MDCGALIQALVVPTSVGEHGRTPTEVGTTSPPFEVPASVGGRRGLGATLVVLPLLALCLGWLYRATLANWGICTLIAATQPDPVRARGIAVDFPPPGGRWAPGILMGDLTQTLSQVVGRPLPAAIYTRIAAADPGRAYSRFQDPTSPYYQVWIGVYVVPDSDGVAHYGLDEDGQPVVAECLALFEADQRLALPWSGCSSRFPDGNLVRAQAEDFQMQQVQLAGDTYWKVSGAGETWSLFQHGRSPDAAWPFYWFAGTVSPRAWPTVHDQHSLTYQGAFYLRYDPDLSASVVQLYVCPEPVGSTLQSSASRGVRPALDVVSECEAVLARTRVRKREPWVPPGESKHGDAEPTEKTAR